MSDLATIPEPLVMSTCFECTMTKFIQCVVHSRYQVLTIQGNPTEEQLLSAWNNIWEEYLSLSDMPTHRVSVQLTTEIAELYVKLATVEWNLKVLRLGYYADCVKALHSIGMPGEFNPKDLPQYLADMDKIVKLSKGWLIQYQEKQREYEAIQQENKGKPLTEMDFINNLTALAASQGYALNPDQVTVMQYCSMVKRARAAATIQR